MIKIKVIKDTNTFLNHIVVDQEAADIWLDENQTNNSFLDCTFEFEDVSWELLRNVRNSLLSSCDWTDLVHAPLDTEEKEDWVAYRQALRDLPENTIDPSDVTWPEQP